MSLPVLFWDVDTQHDFMDPDGKLPVPGATRIEENLEKLTRFALSHGIPILATVDAHDEDDPEFEEFGPHCIIGSEGQKKIAQTTVAGSQVARLETLEEQIEGLSEGRIPQLIVEKQALDVFEEPEADQIVSVLHPRLVVLYGVATEYCVLRQVRSLRERGRQVTVVSDAIQALDEAGGREAVAQMQRMGAAFAATDAVLAALAAEHGACSG